MAAPVELEVVDRGVAVAIERLRAGLDDFEPGWERTGQRMVAAARPLVPVLTGRLVGDLRASATGAEVVVEVGGPSVPYAGVINFGWPGRNISAARFMEAAENEGDRVVADEIADAITSLIRRVGLN